MTRTELLSRLTAPSHEAWAVEACGGSGKSVLARQLRRRLGPDITELLIVAGTTNPTSLLELVASLDAGLPWVGTA